MVNILEILKETTASKHVPTIYLALRDREGDFKSILFEECEENGLSIEEVRVFTVGNLSD